MKQIIQTDKGATPRGPYSQGVIATGSTLYVAAQGPFDPETGERVDGTFEDQANQVFRNIRAVIEAAGGIVTNWEGGPVHEGGQSLAAATPELHNAAMTLLKGGG